MSDQPGRQHSCIVSNQQVAWPQQLRQIAKPAIFKALRGAHKMEQASGGAIGQGLLRNQLGGKNEIEVGDQHGPIIEEESATTLRTIERLWPVCFTVVRAAAPPTAPAGAGISNFSASKSLAKGQRLRYYIAHETASGAAWHGPKMSETELRQEVLRIGRLLHEKNFVAATDGNISARMDNNSILVTPTGMSKGMLRPEDLLLVDSEGRKLAGTREVSTELACICSSTNCGLMFMPWCTRIHRRRPALPPPVWPWMNL